MRPKRNDGRARSGFQGPHYDRVISSDAWPYAYEIDFRRCFIRRRMLEALGLRP